MKSWLKHPIRVTSRLSWLAAEFAVSAFNYLFQCAFCPEDKLSSARAIWMHKTARRMLKVFQVKTQLTGAIPSKGLLVCNHLSYLDILVIGSLTPCVFVAKNDVRHWPALGWFVTMAGTVFVHRGKRTQAAQSADEIGAALKKGILVALFPEGTSSGGETVLPFKSSLLESAAQHSHLLTAGLLEYELGDGDASEEVCYWKDMTLLPHLINLFSKREVRASLCFRTLRETSSDRKQLARELHAEILRMKYMDSN